jgi:hypothetical protein
MLLGLIIIVLYPGGGQKSLFSIEVTFSSVQDETCICKTSRYNRSIEQALSLYRIVRLHCKDTVPKIQNKYSQKRNCAALFPIPALMYL